MALVAGWGIDMAGLHGRRAGTGSQAAPTPTCTYRRPAALRMLRGLPQILNGGRFFDKEGRRVAAPGQRYQANGVRVQLPAEALKK